MEEVEVKKEVRVIKEFRYDTLYLSNFYKWAFQYKGEWFRTSEHAYQWEKCEKDYDKELIMKTLSPKEAKQIGHKVSCDIKKWDLNKVSVMKDILIAKFSDEQLGYRLLDTGDSILIEGNYWHDNFWGSCYCPKCKNKEGKNHLGKLLMEIRNDIILEHEKDLIKLNQQLKKE